VELAASERKRKKECVYVRCTTAHLVLLPHAVVAHRRRAEDALALPLARHEFASVHLAAAVRESAVAVELREREVQYTQGAEEKEEEKVGLGRERYLALEPRPLVYNTIAPHQLAPSRRLLRMNQRQVAARGLAYLVIDPVSDVAGAVHVMELAFAVLTPVSPLTGVVVAVRVRQRPVTVCRTRHK
jgi:hypothetical protein